MRILPCFALGLSSIVLPAVLATTVHAHIDPLNGMPSRGGDQKAPVCDGDTWGMNGSTTFQPGATITVGVKESIQHIGYFRIAFDRDATASFEDPASIDPINRACNYDQFDQCGAADFCTPYAAETGVTVLWDNVDPHDALTLPGGPSWTWKITLPDIECEKCTLQISQIMEDAIPHGGYCPVGKCPGDNTAPDVYHRCFDITLKRDAAENPGVAPTQTSAPNGIDCAQATVEDGGVSLPDAGVEVVMGAPAGDGDSEGAGGSPSGAEQDGGILLGPPEQPAPALASNSGGCSVMAAQNGPFASLASAWLVALGALARRRSSRRREAHA